MPVDPVRDAAIDVLIRVVEKNAHIAQALDRTLTRKAGKLSGRGRRFLTHLVYGTTRHALLCDEVLTPLLHQPLEKLPLAIRLVLRMGVFQALFCGNVTFPSMVHTSVDLAKKRGHAGTARLVNAVLKRVPQTLEQVSLPDTKHAPAEYLSLRYSMPRWLVDRWLGEFGFETTESICEASSTEAPRMLRTNTALTTRDELQATFKKSNISSTAIEEIPEALTLGDAPVPFTSKAFQHGLFFVQDPASMLPANLLEPQPGETVLDLCGAPGGKTTHISQLTQGKAQIFCNDASPKKFRRVRENIQRLRAQGIQCVASDGRRPPFRQAFDRVLLDAPCSGLGTLRRRPDLKWRLHEQDIPRLATLQQALLRSAIEVCKNGGLVVYSVCTFTPEETGEVITSVLGDGTVAFEDGPEWLRPWKTDTGQYRILPGQSALDGYYLTRLRKIS
ncbi:MAG: 16S rRNA (cytosine(967)-C(5))-methyltransferase RsmB [Candidatus Hydrogenedentes bacterium]|nr:16S rRNA (cytosine(967)-C(5))-methyltransferase RsmB [Candidatus Hydrogenedentota bacterium]